MDSDSEEEKAAAVTPTLKAAAPTVSGASSTATPVPALVSAISALLAAPKSAAVRTSTKSAISSAGSKAFDIFAAFSAACSIADAPKAPLALEALYDEEVLSEEAVLAWHSAPGGDVGLKTRCKPFITWLMEAGDDDDEEESE